MSEPKQLSAEEVKEMAYYAEVEGHEPSLKLLAYIAFLEGVIRELGPRLTSDGNIRCRILGQKRPLTAAWLKENYPEGR